MFCLFNPQSTVSIGLFEGAPEAVVLAAKDLQRNLQALSARTDGFPIVIGRTGISVTVEGGETESYTVTVNADGVRIVGGDALGAVFGIYAFATKVLGIEPTYRVTDIFPASRPEMTVEDVTFCSAKRAIRFRGWFLNDEDLLTEFKSGGGVRHFDYRFYQTVMHTDVLDMILETALRHEINLMIPSSFVDIDNPDEEKLADAVCRRGMYITQHHVEPMGVSYFGAQNYMKKYGREGEVSFISNRAVMEEIWAYYAKKWVKYGDRVIWQLGLRGRADEAVWKRDKNVPMTSEGRGAIITDAISTQYDIVRKTLGHDKFVSTSTLWLEGAQLYGEGHLKMPKNTMVVFSDIGLDQMFGDDFYTTKRQPNEKYGIYYHVAFYSQGPHLAEGCDPLKMAYCYREALKMDSLTYAIVNVSNVRPLHYSIAYNAALMADPEGADYRTFSEDFHRRHFGSAAETVMALRDRYYLSKTQKDEENLKRKCDDQNFFYHQYNDLSFPRYTADDGAIWVDGKRLLNGKPIGKYRDALVSGEAAFTKLYEDACAVEAIIPTECLNYYRTFLKYQIEYMLMMTRWLLACHDIVQSQGEDRRRHAERAASCLEHILKIRSVETQGQWQGWHNGEKKLNILETLALTRAAGEVAF